MKAWIVTVPGNKEQEVVFADTGSKAKYKSVSHILDRIGVNKKEIFKTTTVKRAKEYDVLYQNDYEFRPWRLSEICPPEKYLEIINSQITICETQLTALKFTRDQLMEKLTAPKPQEVEPAIIVDKVEMIHTNEDSMVQEPVSPLDQQMQDEARLADVNG